ncbi:hypothetical protein [Paenibacillus validus]|uniref:hypothetical protein n=1 Tax=Paenibacillus validus TaxID=44253 RepID=UPI003D2B5F4E
MTISLTTSLKLTFKTMSGTFTFLKGETQSNWGHPETIEYVTLIDKQNHTIYQESDVLPNSRTIQPSHPNITEIELPGDGSCFILDWTSPILILKDSRQAKTWIDRNERLINDLSERKFFEFSDFSFQDTYTSILQPWLTKHSRIQFGGKMPKLSLVIFLRRFLG